MEFSFFGGRGLLVHRQEAMALAEKFIEEQKARDIIDLKNNRNRLISNPNIVSLFNDIKDMAKQSEYKQVIFLNPLRYLFSEEYSSAKHWGIYKDCYGNLQSLGTISKYLNRDFDLKCGKPGIILLGNDRIYEIPFSQYNLPNFFEIELILVAFIVELQNLFPNYSVETIEADTDSDYGITEHKIKLIVLPEQTQLDHFLENYLFNYGIVEIQGYDKNSRKHLIDKCITFYDYKGSFFSAPGTIGIVSEKKYCISKAPRSAHESPVFYANTSRIVGINLRSTTNSPVYKIETPLTWF